MVRRFVAWQREEPQIDAEIRDYISTITPEEFEALTEGGRLDPSIDSEFLLNLRHPFPGIERVQKRLNKLGIGTPFDPYNGPRLPIQCVVHWSNMSGPGFHVLMGSAYKVRDSSGQLVYEGATEFSMQWQLPLVSDYDRMEPAIDFLVRTGEMPYEFISLPGSFLPDIARYFSHYLALREVEAWAVSNVALAR